MSHCAKQIRDWVKTSLTGVSGLPTPVIGVPRQFAKGAEYVAVRSLDEPITIETIGDLEARTHNLEIIAISNSYDEVDAMSLLIEERLQAATGFPGKMLTMSARRYDEDKTTDRDYVSVTLELAAVYHVDSDDLETFV